MLKHFRGSLIITFVGLVLAWWFGGTVALFATAILIVLEISLSFDNAVVNATVLKRMSPVWQRRFLTWGILIAVFGVRFVLPIVIVAVASKTGLFAVLQMAIFESERYGNLLENAKPSIASFGGMFLLMVFLKYFFDDAKKIHWIEIVEKWLTKIGALKSVEIIIALGVLVVLALNVPEALQTRVLISGILGTVMYVLMHSVSEFLEVQESKAVGAYAGLGLFLYLEILDVSFSLDGVIAAFAITSNIFIIMLGLSIGAYFVRSMTLYFVHKNTLQQFRYLEHGAHYAVGILGILMLAGITIHIPEVLTALLGGIVIIISGVSSVMYTRAQLKLK